MTEPATPAIAGADAQPVADANSIDSLIDNAATEGAKPESENAAEQDAGKQDDDTPFPKKAINALSRRDKQIGKLRAQYEAAQAELTKLREAPASKATPATDGAPKEADFKSYAEYLEARTEYLAEQKIEKRFAEHAAKTTETAKAQQDTQWQNERIASVDKQSEEFAKQFPEVEAMYHDNADLLQSLPATIKRAFLAADNAPLAFYNLAKEGKLADLADMSVEDAKVEIRLAQMATPQKPKTNAPKPLSASRGSVAASKSLDAMDGDELLAWVKS